MPNQTIQNVPWWAQETVAKYASKAWSLSQETAEPPFVTITSGQGAKLADVVIEEGHVIAIPLLTGGYYYTEAPSIQITPNDSFGTGAVAHCNITDGIVTSVELDNGGYDYQVNPSATIKAKGSGATAMAVITGDVVSEITVLTGGGGYGVAPNVIVFGGEGAGVLAHAELVEDKVNSIYVDNGGSGFDTDPTVFAIYGGTIIAPQNANELDAISALAARGSEGNATIDAAYDIADNIITETKLNGIPFALATKINTQGSAAFASVRSLIGQRSSYLDSSALLAQTLTVNSGATYLTRLLGRLENANYRSERMSQDTAIGMGIEIAKQAVTDAEMLHKAGVYAREYLQSTYELTHKLWLENQELPVFMLEIFGNALRALTGSMQQTTQDVNNPSGLMQAVGLVATTAGIYSALSEAGLFAMQETAASLAATATEMEMGAAMLSLAAVP